MSLPVNLAEFGHSKGAAKVTRVYNRGESCLKGAL